jgi:hypothetical protein
MCIAHLLSLDSHHSHQARREAKRAAASSIDSQGVESGEAVKGKVKRRKKGDTTRAQPGKKKGGRAVDRLDAAPKEEM